MPAQLKVYTDSGHSSEVAHTANVSTTLSAAVSSGASVLPLTTTTGMPAQGFVDVDTGGSLETLPYTSISGNNVNLSKATSSAHSSGAAVVQWYYQLAVGDQTNGIINDGTQASPTGQNTATWYLYNAGDQTAQSPTIATSNVSPSTTSGYSDTQVSITSASTGFATSVAPSNIAAGAQVQFWVEAGIPSGQSNIGNPQLCVINLAYSSI